MKVAGIDRCVFLLDLHSIRKIYVGPFLITKFDHLLQTTQRINVRLKLNFIISNKINLTDKLINITKRKILLKNFFIN